MKKISIAKLTHRLALLLTAFMLAACNNTANRPGPTGTPLATKPAATSTALPSATFTPTPAPFDREALIIAIYTDRQYDLYRMDLDGSNLQQLTNDPGTKQMPAWAPDGRHIAYTYIAPDSTQPGIYTMYPDGSHPTRLTSGFSDFFPDWSPDSRHIAFISMDENRRRDLHVIAAEGSTPVPLTQNGIATDARPAWSPDGRYIVFAGKNPDESNTLYVVDADGANLTALVETSVPEEWVITAVDWSPDGRFIAYAITKTVERTFASIIILYDVTGKKPVEVILGNVETLLPVQSMLWSPDGSRLLVQDYNHVLTILKADGSPSGQGISSSDLLNLSANPDWFMPGASQVAAVVERPESRTATPVPTRQPSIDTLTGDITMMELMDVCQGSVRSAAPAYQPGSASAPHPLAVFKLDMVSSTWQVAGYPGVRLPYYTPSDVQLVACISEMYEALETCRYGRTSASPVERTISRTRQHVFVNIYEARSGAGAGYQEFYAPLPLPCPATLLESAPLPNLSGGTVSLADIYDWFDNLYAGTAP